jgi:DNA-binding transcriptional LysR family regulator
MTRSIDIRQLRYFVAVAQERSFRRAAERLHITQPPLSRQIGELESALGTRLLARDTRRVELTSTGELALREFEALVHEFDAAVERVAKSAPAASRLRLGALYWSDLKSLQGLKAALTRSGHPAGVDVHTVASHEGVAAVRRGTLDASLIAAPTETHGLPCTVVGKLRMAAFVPAASTLARRRQLSLQDLNGLPPFYRFRRQVNPLLHDHFARQLATHGFRPRALAAAPEVMGVLAQIASGHGCTCMPDLPNHFRYAGVVRRSLREDVTMDLALVISPRLNPATADLLLQAVRRMVRPAHPTRRAPIRSSAP